MNAQNISVTDTKIKELVAEAVIAAMESFRSQDQDSDAFLIEEEAAELLRVQPQTMRSWRHEGRGPEYRKHGGRVVYSKNNLLAYSEQNAVK